MPLEISKKVVCAVDPSAEDIEKLRCTIDAYEDACNYLSNICFQKKVFDSRILHNLAYRDIRAIFKLPASLAVRAINRVISSYKEQPHKHHIFRERSLPLDKRIFSLKRSKHFIASLTTPMGRAKVKLALGERQKNALSNPVAGARLVLRRRRLYIHIYVICHVTRRSTEEPVGVDLGTRKLMMASNGFMINGGQVRARRYHFKTLLDSLRTKGTSSARKRLKQLSGREKRWMRTFLHQSSRALIESLDEGDYLVLERLYGTKMKPKGNRPSRSHRSGRNGQDCGSSTLIDLQHMISYKCEEMGIPVTLVRPDYTSQRCPRCGTIDKYNRRSQALFRCVNCGYQDNADFVASINLRELALGGWVAVSQPDAVHSTL